MKTKTAGSVESKLKEAWLSPKSFATILLVMFVDKYGTEGLGWAPQTIKMQVEEDFGITLPMQNLDRLLAAVTLVTTNYFYKRINYFNELCNVLSGDTFNPTVFRPADVVDCAWGITEAMLISPPDEPEPFTEEIRHYIAKLLEREGFVKPPDILRIAIGADKSDAVRGDFEDDPEMFAAIYQSQASRNSDVTDTIKDNIKRLLDELQVLPLENGSAVQLRDKLRTEIRS